MAPPKRRGNNPVNKVARKQTTKPAKAKAPLFVQGERPLPNKVSPATANLNKQGMAHVKIPIPAASQDYEDGRVVGWVVQARFVVKDKCMFVSDTNSSAVATVKVPVSHRDADVKLRVMGEPEEIMPVIFQITPYFVQDMAFGLGAIVTDV